jgi:hypothetical protein
MSMAKILLVFISTLSKAGIEATEVCASVLMNFRSGFQIHNERNET